MGDSNGAKKDFDLEIINNPLNGDAYFQRGLETYWTERDYACEDLIKGISLGAVDSSSEFLNENAQSNSFLDELFIGNDKVSFCIFGGFNPNIPSKSHKV